VRATDDAGPPEVGWTDRFAATVVLLAGVVTVFALSRVVPDNRGIGTHEQLGMQPCGWPESMGAPCPTCGVTTAATHLVHLSPIRALATQPFGAALAAGGIWLALFAGYCLLRRRPFVARLALLPYGTIALWTLVVFLLSWLYKWATFAP